MMTGRLHPYLPELSLRDYNIYLRYMRGVEYQVYLDFGIVPYGALFSYRGGVMALLADSLAGRQATCQDIRLPGSLSRVPVMCQTKGIRLAAQIEVLMSWHRLQDRRNEELPLKQQMERMSQKVTLQGAYRKAAQEEPALERIFCQQQAQAAAQQQLDRAQEQADQIVASAQKTAAARSEEMLNEARSQAAALKQKAEADIAQERKKAVNEVKDEIGGMAIEIASKVVEREIKESDHKALIDEFIQNVGEAS